MDGIHLKINCLWLFSFAVVALEQKKLVQWGAIGK